MSYIRYMHISNWQQISLSLFWKKSTSPLPFLNHQVLGTQNMWHFKQRLSISWPLLLNYSLIACIMFVSSLLRVSAAKGTWHSNLSLWREPGLLESGTNLVHMKQSLLAAAAQMYIDSLIRDTNLYLICWLRVNNVISCECCAPNNNHVEETLDPRCKITVPPDHK